MSEATSHHDESSVRRWIEQMLPRFIAGECEREIYYTLDESPCPFERWADPCDLVAEIQPPTVDDLLRFLPQVDEESAREAAERCFELYLESAIWAAYVRRLRPLRPDVAFRVQFPAVTPEEASVLNRGPIRAIWPRNSGTST